MVVLKNSVLVTFIYDTDEIRYSYNEFIEYLENLKVNLGEDNECLNNIIKECKLNRMHIRQWFNTTVDSIDRNKRQAGILGGVVGLFTLGLTEMQIYDIHETLYKMQNNVDKNRGEIKILAKIMKYNSHSLELFRKTQIHTNDILHNVAFQVNETVHEINEVKKSMFCINLKLSFIDITKMVNKVWQELKVMIEYKFNKNLLSWISKNKFVMGLKKKSYKLLVSV